MKGLMKVFSGGSAILKSGNNRIAKRVHNGGRKESHPLGRPRRVGLIYWMTALKKNKKFRCWASEENNA